MKQTVNEMDEHVLGILNKLRPAPPLDAHTAELERANFLAKVERMRVAVSPQPKMRQMKWIDNIKLTLQRKELSPMISTILTIAIAVSFLLGGVGTTTYAAQTSQPDQPLYPLKTLSEEIRFHLANSPQTKLDLAIAYTNRRMDEIRGLLAENKPIQVVVIERFGNELDLALQVTAGMDDQQMAHALEQIRLQANTQAQEVFSWMNSGGAQVNLSLERLWERLREQANLAGLGETNPDAFRLQIRDRDRLRAPLQTPQSTGAWSGKQNPTVTATGEKNAYGPGPFAGPGVTPSGHYGSGPRTVTATCTPVQDGTGPGPGPGPNPTDDATGNPGPGPQAGTASCTPVSDGTGPGPRNPTSTPEPQGGSGGGQSTATAQENGNPGNGQPTDPPGNGGRP
jgi:hypothetical protein